jgi:hypothetical protein
MVKSLPDLRARVELPDWNACQRPKQAREAAGEPLRPVPHDRRGPTTLAKLLPSMPSCSNDMHRFIDLEEDACAFGVMLASSFLRGRRSLIFAHVHPEKLGESPLTNLVTRLIFYQQTTNL